MKINNETEFKKALDGLTPMQQRQVGILFVEHVLSLATEIKLGQLLQLAQKKEIEADELNKACQEANAIAVKTYTFCGENADWIKQAGHFVGVACTACLKPKVNSWSVAMNCRMALVCKGIAQLKDDRSIQEAIAQYQIMQEFLEQTLVGH